MKLLLLILALSPLQLFADSSHCEDDKGMIRIYASGSQGVATSFTVFRAIKLDQINETLPSGVYSPNQDINEAINWHFQDDAIISLEQIKENSARLRIIGQDDSAPSYVAYSKTLHCYGNLF